ncbi:MAG: response regulator [Campylobacterales bacterium]
MISPETLKKQTILLVEDDAIARESWAIILRRMSAQVYEAANGAEAIEIVEAHHPDLVITDLEMPVMGGMELIDRLKDAYPKLPIVVATAFDDEYHQTPRADAVLVKPIEKSRLHEVLLQVATDTQA